MCGNRLMTLKKKALENTVGKGEKAGDQYFLHFPQCFQFYQREKSSFNSLPNNKILDQSNLKALADDKINVTEKLI